jgi:large subunit ribosomal protein L9
LKETTMKVILSEDVETLGKVGDVINVSTGYARNFLLPRSLAVLATSKNLGEVEHKKRVIQHKLNKLLAEAQDYAKRLEALSLTIPQKVGEEDKLFGSVTNQTIQQALKEEGFEVDRKKIVLDEPIRKLGAYAVPLKLSQGVVANLRVTVVAEE